MSKHKNIVKEGFNIDDMNRYLYGDGSDSFDDEEDVELNILRCIEENSKLNNNDNDTVFENVKFRFNDFISPIFTLEDHVRTVLSIDLSLLSQNKEANKYFENIGDEDIREAIIMSVNACYPIAIIDKSDYMTSNLKASDANYLFASSHCYNEDYIYSNEFEYIYHMDNDSNKAIDAAIEYAITHGVFGTFMVTIFNNLFSTKNNGVNFRNRGFTSIINFKNSEYNQTSILEHFEKLFNEDDFYNHEIDISSSYMDLMLTLNNIIYGSNYSDDCNSNDCDSDEDEEDDYPEDYSDLLEGESDDSAITPDETVENKFGIKSDDYEPNNQRIIKRPSLNNEDSNESFVVNRR